MELPSLMIDPDIEPTLQNSYGIETERDICDGGTGSLEDLLHWLGRPPMYTTLRVNTSSCTTQQAADLLSAKLQEVYTGRTGNNFEVRIHPSLSDCLVVENSGPHLPSHQTPMEVVVDVHCGMAILRGADIFKQGILAAPSNMQAGSLVRIMADLDGKCLRGLTQPYQGNKLYVGLGYSLVSRDEIFRADPKTLRGVGIQMREPLYRAPPLSDTLPGVVFPQNLPSIVCGHVLGPRPGNTVIDMCAAPGGKTTHLACLMQNKGRVVALDKSADKVSKINSNAEAMKLSCIEAYAFDARKAVKDGAALCDGPPYPPGSFDAVLVDGPCSALGQRPSVCNKMTAKALASFPPLQRMLLSAAVSLLRPGGVLVYSTCTVTVEENEQQAAWLLNAFPDMSLQPQVPHIGGTGCRRSLLSREQCQLVQRFDPSRLDGQASTDCNTDTIGFFIAKFRKKDR